MLAALPASATMDQDLFAYVADTGSNGGNNHPASHNGHSERIAQDEFSSQNDRYRAPNGQHETIVAATVVREEPILHAIRENVQSFRNTVQDVRRQTPGLYVLLVAAVMMAAIIEWPVVLALAVLLGTVYGVYRLIWTLVVGSDSPSRQSGPRPARSRPQDAQVVSPPGEPSPSSGRRMRGIFRRRERPAAAMLIKSPRERVADLLGSMLGSTLVAAAMCVVMLLIESFRADTASLPKPEQFAWLLLVSVAGAWGILIPSKLWEGYRGDAMLRRFLLMVIGMGVGVVAFAAGDWLMVSLPPAAGYPASPGYGLPLSFYAQNGHPLLLAHVACFGTLFLLVRWWHQTDPLRVTRLSMSRLVVCIVIAGAVAWAWQFPQPWLPMIAGTISVSIQLASPWLTLNRRRWQ
jgi:hypothetical protein